MSPDRIDEVRMAVVEACINALEHSHAADREVFVTFQVLGERGTRRSCASLCATAESVSLRRRWSEPTIEDEAQVAAQARLGAQDHPGADGRGRDPVRRRRERPS